MNTPKLKPESETILQLESIAQAQTNQNPYPHIIASDVINRKNAEALNRDFPDIKKSGFFPLSSFKSRGTFAEFISDLQKPGLSALLTEKLGIELRDKPQLITIRKWSQASDGRIHNDSESKIATSLFYLNDDWHEGEDGGRFRVLSSETSFDSSVSEVPPNFGNFVAFRRTENSWHGHKPFTGERKVVQVTWLRSWEDYNRKQKRGKLTYLFKRLLSPATGM